MPSSTAQLWCTNQPRTIAAPEAEAPSPPSTSFSPSGDLWDAVEAVYSATGANGNVWRFDDDSMRVSSNVGDGVEDSDLVGFVHDWRSPGTVGAALTQEGVKRPDFDTISLVECLSFIGDQDTNDNEHLLTPSIIDSPEGTLILVGRITDAADARQCLFEAGPWRLDGVFDGTPPAVRVGSSQWKQFGLSSAVDRWTCFVIQWSTSTNMLRLYYDGGLDWADFEVSSWMSNTIGALNRNSYLSDPAASPYGAPATAAYKSVVWCDQWLTDVDQLQAFVDFAVDGTSIDITIPSSSTPVSGSNDGTIPTPTLPTVNVTNASELTAALLVAEPGVHIVLANGTYSGTFNTSVDGTSSNPIVIKALNFGVPVVNGQIVLNNPFNVVYGLDFTSSQSNGNVLINADDCRVLRVTTTNSTRGVKVNSGKKRFEIAYCDISGGAQPIQIVVAGNTTIPMYGWCHHNKLSDSSSNPIEQGTNGTHSAVPLSVLSEYNLVLRCGNNSSVACKSSNNIFFRNTAEDCGSARMQARHGRNCIFMSNYLDNSAGILLNGVGHLSIGNVNDYAAGTGNYDVHGAACGDKWQEDFEGINWGSVAYHPPAENCTFIENVPFVRIGAGGLSKPLKPRNNRIESTTSSWEQNSNQTNTTKVTTLSRSVPGTVPLTSGMVGPLATPAGQSYQELYGGNYGPTVSTPAATAAQLAANPFNDQSAFHRPIRSTATYAEDSHPSRIAWMAVVPANNGQTSGGTIGAINQGNPFGIAASYASASDPSRTFRRRNCTDTANSTLNWDPGGTSVVIRIPDSNTINTNASYQCFENTSFIVQSDYTTYEFFQTNRSGTDYRASICRVADVRGLGHGSALNERVGVSASGCSVRMGMLTAASLLAEEEIGHALKLAIYSGTGSQPYQLLSRNIQWPACNADSFASNPSNNNGPFPYGSLLALLPSLDLSTLGLTTPQGYILGRCMQNYGCYAMDDADGIVLRCDGSLGASASAIVADYRKLLRHLRLVLNSVSGATATIAADGGYNQTGSIGTPNNSGTAIASNTALVLA